MLCVVGHDSYIHAWHERWSRERSDDAAEAARAREVAERLAGMLAERYGATRVVLTGSLARGDFGIGSDIDLGVEGLAPGDLFRAGADAERLADGFEVDLIPLESASPDFLARLRDEGILLHDAKAG